MRNNHLLSYLNITTSCLLYIKSLFFQWEEQWERNNSVSKDLMAGTLCSSCCLHFTSLVSTVCTKGVQPSLGLHSTWKYLSWYWSFIASGSRARGVSDCIVNSEPEWSYLLFKKEAWPVLVQPRPLHHLLQRVRTSINKALIRQHRSQSQSLMGVCGSNTC